MLANGDNFSDAISAIFQQVEASKNDNLIAIGVNCINPCFVSKLFKSAQNAAAAADKMKNVPFIVYPNSGIKNLNLFLF